MIVAGALLVVALADGGLRVKKLLVEPDSTGQKADKQMDKPVKTASYRVSNITRVHLFGHETKKSAPKPKAVKASKTTLKLDLVGVIASVDPEFARALISPNKRKIKSYAIGELIDSTDAKLFAVDSDKVTLERNGKYETLLMERRSIGGSSEKPVGSRTSSRRTTARNSSTAAEQSAKSTNKSWRSRFSKRGPSKVDNTEKNDAQAEATTSPGTAKDPKAE